MVLLYLIGVVKNKFNSKIRTVFLNSIGIVENFVMAIFNRKITLRCVLMITSSGLLKEASSPASSILPMGFSRRRCCTKMSPRYWLFGQFHIFTKIVFFQIVFATIVLRLNSAVQVFLIHEAFTESELGEILASVRASRELVTSI